MKKAFCLLALASLTACGEPALKIESEPASFAFLASAPKERLGNGNTKTTVRVFKSVQGSGGKTVRKEIRGAKCTLTSDHLRAEVVTPQQVVLPKYDQDAKLEARGVPPSILISCKSGDLNGSFLLAAKPGQIISGSGNLVADLILITGSAIAANTADWRYPEAVFVNVE
ncbi:hypothetical protein A9D60_09890 [Leisingera sp. JC1]|nr:hypothetical protein A9D60_09890 [Leisingera sp. JC1]